MNKQTNKRQNKTYEYREQTDNYQLGWMGKMGEEEWEIQAFNYGRSKSWE